MELHFVSRDINPKMTGTIEERIARALTFRDAGVIGQAIIDCLREFPEVGGLDEYEKLIRLMQGVPGRVYLLAVDAAQAPPNQLAFDFRTNAPAPYWVWISVNGLAEAQTTWKQFGIPDYKTNLIRLKTCGFLSVKS